MIERREFETVIISIGNALLALDKRLEMIEALLLERESNTKEVH